MSHWYAKARDSIIHRRAGVRETEPFSRPCVCGETITGERLPQAREIACPNCGRAWFILPLDPYPDSRSRRRSKSKTPKRPSWLRRRSARPAAGDPPSETNEPGRSNGTSAVSLAPKTPPKTPLKPVAAAVPAESPAGTRWRWSHVKQASRDWLRREARPIRLVLAGCALALVVTGLWLWHRSRIDGASATIVQVVPQAEQALNDRDFDTAERLLAQAVDAVDLLGAEDETAARIRQRHRELVALNHLAGKTPFDLAVEAGLHEANPVTWETEFAASYADRWVVFDVPLVEPRRATPPRPTTDSDPAEPPRRETRPVIPVELSLTAGTKPVRFEIDARLVETLKSPDRVIFAAQYASWLHQDDADGEAVWVVRLRPETAFLWTSPDTLAELGIGSDNPTDELREVLKSQAAAVGVPFDQDGEPEPAASDRDDPL